MENKPEQENKDSQMKSSSNNGWLWIVGALIVLVVVGVWVWTGGAIVPADQADTTATTTEDQTDSEGSTSTDPEVGEDSVQEIQQQLEGINVEDIEGEFQNIDQDLQDLESGGSQ